MPTQEPPPPTCDHCPHKEQAPKTQPHAPESFGFLKSFLPGNFNAEDLLVVMLLLLMCGEHRDDGKLPLLTLALYLFL